MAAIKKVIELNDLIDKSQREKIGNHFLLKAVKFALQKEFGKSYEFFKIGLDSITCDSDRSKDWLEPYRLSDKTLFDENIQELNYEYFFVKAYILSHKSSDDQLKLALEAIDVYLKNISDEYGYYVKGKILLGLKDVDQAYISFMISQSLCQSARSLYQIGMLKEEFLKENGLKELYIAFLKNPSSTCCGIALRKYTKKHAIIARYSRDNILLEDFFAYEDEDWEFSVTFNAIQDGILLPEDRNNIIHEFVEFLKINRRYFIEEEEELEEEKEEESNETKTSIYDVLYGKSRFDVGNGYFGNDIDDVFDGHSDAMWNVD